MPVKTKVFRRVIMRRSFDSCHTDIDVLASEVNAFLSTFTTGSIRDVQYQLMFMGPTQLLLICAITYVE